MRLDKAVRAQKKKEVIWNMIGSIANTSTTVILLMAVTNICGPYHAGIFSIAFATAQIMMIIGNYGVRAYQATDILPKYNLTQYVTHRSITCGIMMLACLLYCLITKAQAQKFWVIFLLCLLKMFEALADVFEGYMQQIGHLDVAGKSMFFRTLLFSVVFIIALLVSRNLIISSLLAAITSGIMIVFFNIIPVYQCEKFKISVEWIEFKGLSKECFSLFIAMFLMMYLVNAPKYAIDSLMTPEYQTYYNILYTPAQVINLLSAFAFKPVLTDMAKYWENNETKKLKEYILKFLVYIIGITGLSIGIAYFLGIPVLSFAYGVELKSFKSALLAILIGGGFNAAANMLYYVLTAIRMQKGILMSYAIVAVMALMVPHKFVAVMGLMGAVFSYILLMSILVILMSIIMFQQTHKTGRIIKYNLNP